MQKATKLNIVVIVVVLVALSSSILLATAPTSQARPAVDVPMPPQQINLLAPPQQGSKQESDSRVGSNRVQFGLRASDHYLVWREMDRSLRPEVDDLRDSQRVVGYDVQTGRKIQAGGGKLVQVEPSVSGSTLVWMAMDCATCEADIMAMDLATGKSFAVANTNKDESHPAVGGNYVAWLQPDGSKNIALVVKNLTTSHVTTVASLPADKDKLFDFPKISAEYLVWSEINTVQGRPTDAVLHAYRLTDGKSSAVANLPDASVTYLVADHRVLWSGPGTYLGDLNSGKSERIFDGEMLSPFLSGETIVWSQINPATDVMDVWGLDLNNRLPLPLSTGGADKLDPVFVGDKLLWHYDVSGQGSYVVDTSLHTAVTSAPARAAALADVAREAKQRKATDSIDTGVRRTTNGYAWYKGIFGPPSGPDSNHPVAGWKEWGEDGTTDNVVASSLFDDPSTNNPQFGSLQVISGVLNFTTQYTPYPYVKDVLQRYQEQGAKIIVRLPSHRPGHYYFREPYPDVFSNTNGFQGQSPYDIVLDARGLLNSQPWIQSHAVNVVVDNEPADEWLNTCVTAPCGWCGGHKLYYWNGIGDERKYRAVNDFYVQVRKLLDSDVTLKQMEQDGKIVFWPPPMNPDWPDPALPGIRLHELVGGMINAYAQDGQGRVSYNVYPYPARNIIATVDVLTPQPTQTLGHLRNRTFDMTFNPDQRTAIVSGTIKSQISELGWQPGSIYRCFGQDDTWLAAAPTPCTPQDNLNHRFEEDVNYLLTSDQRRNAESVNVWILRGWNERADGINQYGTPTNWFTRYRASNP